MKDIVLLIELAKKNKRFFLFPTFRGYESNLSMYILFI